MNTASFSSGVVVGMTHIPADTIRRYVRDFRPYFSESARQPNRGRRYTSQDVQSLLTIRHLYHERKPKPQIEAALTGNWTPPALPRYDIEDATAIVAQAREHMEETTKQARKVERMTQSIVSDRSYLFKQIRQLQDEIKRLQEEIKTCKQPEKSSW
jgi:DNA-binding transcriptional MerR regulator